jgi:uncharacterized protein YerC
LNVISGEELQDLKTNRAVTQRQEQQHERSLCAAILALRSIDECRSFFRDLCTPA